LASHGGAIGIIVAMILYCRKQKENWLWLFDRLVIVVPLAAMFIRIGNLINSEIIGHVTNVPWAFIFSREDNLPRHPAQLYEAIYCLFLFVLFQFLRMRNGIFLLRLKVVIVSSILPVKPSFLTVELLNLWVKRTALRRILTVWS
jgi:prolipoprotein diacylglyceryltransferase